MRNANHSIGMVLQQRASMATKYYIVRRQAATMAAGTAGGAPKKQKFNAGGWFSGLFGGGKRTEKLQHRPFGKKEMKYVRLATRKKDKVMEGNPGVRVEPSFITSDEAGSIVGEALDIIEKFGISHVTDDQRMFYANQMKHLPLPKEELGKLVNMMRVTGRFESDQQKLAPWGHGENFDIQQVPSSIRTLLNKIKDSEHFCLGKPRDITVNYRTSYFYRLDPHVDPLKDGENVFILGLLSGTVITLSPSSRTMSAHQFLHQDLRKVSEQSWQPGKDIDVDLEERALLHLSGPARSTWNHGIRLGVTQHQIEDYLSGLPAHIETALNNAKKDSGLPLFDWFGSMKELRIRKPERLSIIFAFGDPE